MIKCVLTWENALRATESPENRDTPTSGHPLDTRPPATLSGMSDSPTRPRHAHDMGKRPQAWET